MNIGRLASIANISIVKILKNGQSIDKSCIVKLSKSQKYRKKGYRKKIPKHSSIIKKLRSKYRKKKNQCHHPPFTFKVAYPQRRG